jgi:hypothetical protein
MTQDVTDADQPTIPSPPTRTARTLAGWMPQQEAIQHVLGRVPSTPVEEATAVAIAESRRAAVAARTSSPFGNPIVATTNRDQLLEIASRPQLHTTFAGQFAGVEWVDLTRVISIQKLVFTDGAARVAAAVREGSPDELIELCIPSNPQLSQFVVGGDADGRGLTIVSEDPNVRYQGAIFGDFDVSQGVGAPRLMKAVSFLIGTGSPYLSVAQYQGRFYLQNGYHRAAALLQRGITVVPAVMTAMQSYDELAAPGGGLFGHGVASAATPPMLTDYWDDTVSVETTHSLSRKVLRMRGDEFCVNV